MLSGQFLFNSEPNKFFIYHFGLEKCSLMSNSVSFLKLSFRKNDAKVDWNITCMLQMVCLAVTSPVTFFHNNYFHIKLFKSDLASRPTKI